MNLFSIINHYLVTLELRFDTVGLLFVGQPDTIDALKDNIQEAIGEIRLHTIKNVLKIWTDRVGYCVASQGSYLNKLFSIINRKDFTFK